MAGKKKTDVVDNNIDILDLKNDLVGYIDDELEKKIDSMFNQKIRNEFIESINISNGKLIKEKNKNIFLKNIIIVVLIVIIFYLTYLLYSANYFDKYFIKNNEPNNVSEVDNKNNNVVDQTDPISTLEKLKSEYAYLLDSVIISRSSRYIEDYYSGNLSDELKKYLALNQISFDKLEVENDYNVISSSTFSMAYKKLFDGNFENSSFDYNGNRVRYFNKLDSYVTDFLLVKDELVITREIISISIVNDNIVIETVEGIVGANKLFNVLSLEEVITYNNDSILNYQDALNKVVYTFKKSGKLISIK